MRTTHYLLRLLVVNGRVAWGAARGVLRTFLPTRPAPAYLGARVRR